MSFLTKDVLFFPEPSPLEDDETVWVAMNVFTRTSIALDAEGVKALSRTGPDMAITEKKFRIWEISRFSNEDGLLADPSRFWRDSKKWPPPSELNFDQWVQVLKKNFILIEDEKNYQNYFGRKTSVLDNQHLGNLHDQIGSFMMLSRRKSPSQWWIEQKFKSDLSSTREDSLYGAVEGNYLKNYFSQKITSGLRVLDLGCGVGYFSSLMADHGAQVLGIDPNPDYIQIAKTRFGNRVQFEVTNIGHEGDLKSLKSESFDFVFMSDTLLFYFVPLSTKDTPSLKTLLGDISRVLKPEGVFCSIESHPVFYQAPWMGSEHRPFTIKTEYRNKVTSVVPTVSEMGRAFTENNFAITWMDELFATEPYSGPLRDFNFGREFPLWILFELRKRNVP